MLNPLHRSHERRQQEHHQPSLETMALVTAGLNCTVADLLTDTVIPSVLIGADDMAPTQEALAVLGSVLTARKNGPRPAPTGEA